VNNKIYKNVKVVSLMEEVYEEMFLGEKIVFKPKESKVMNRYDAAMFLGQYSGWDNVRNAPKIKMFKTEPVFEEPEKIIYTSQVDGKTFDSPEDLEKHLEVLRKRIMAR
jgi:hypothetical protein